MANYRIISSLLLLFLVVRAAPLAGQTYAIRPYAGTGVVFFIVPPDSFGDGGLATNAIIDHPSAVALDAAGNLYIADRGHNQIRCIAADTRIITTVAGTGASGYSGDNGPAQLASLRAPQGLTIDSAGNIYIADSGNHVIRRISADGQIITTVAGTGTAGLGLNNVAATRSALNSPAGIALRNNVEMFIADTGNNVVRYVDSTGIMRTPANMFQSANCATSTLCAPQSVVWARNEIWITDTGHCRIGSVDPSNFWNIRFGQTSTPCSGGGGDGTAAISARIDRPSALAFTERGEILIAESAGSRIRRIPSNSPLIETVAGTGVRGFSGDGGLAVNATLSGPLGIAADALGRVFIADTNNNRVRLLDGCVEISPSSASFNSLANTGKIQVTGPKGCKWLLDSQVPWMGFASVGAGDGTGTAEYRVEENNGPARRGTMRIGTRIFTVDQEGFSLPTVAPDGLINSGDFSPAAITPGGRFSLRGRALAAVTQSANSSPLPFRLADTSVSVNQLPARLLSISPTQLDLQAPWTFQADQATLGLFVNGRQSFLSVPGSATSPTLFNAGNGLALARKLRQDGSDSGPVSSTNRLAPGDYVLLYAGSTGIVDKPPADGALAKGPTTSYRPIWVKIGGVEAPVVTATLANGGDISGVGVSTVIARVPPEVPAGNEVPVILVAGSRPSAPLALPIGPVQPLTVRIEISEPDVKSAAPASWLALRGGGLHPAAPAAVRFFNSLGYSRTVDAVDVTTDSLVTTVPLYYDSGKGDFGPGVVSIQVLQLINGNIVTSNRIDGFEIQDLPQVNLGPGQVTSAMLRALSQSMTEVEGGLASIDAVTQGRLGTSGTRARMNDLDQKAAAVKAAVDDITNNPGKSLPLGILDGEPVSLDASVLASTDRVLAALILAQPPYDPPSADFLGSGSGASPFSAEKKGSSINFATVTFPECEVPDLPAGKQLRNLLTGGRPSESYARDYYTCLDRLRRVQTAADISNDLRRWTKYADNKLKQAWTFLGVPVATLAVAEGPATARTSLIRGIVKFSSFPTYVNLVGQSILGLYALAPVGDSEENRRLAGLILRNLRSQLRSEIKEKAFEAFNTRHFEDLQFRQPEALGKTFTAWVIASIEAEKHAKLDAADKVAEPTVQFDGKGGNEVKENQPPETVAVTGTVSNPATGAPLQDSQIEACPPLPGQASQAPRAKAPTYDDGSYAVIVPVNFTQSDSKLCKLVIRPKKKDDAPDQTGVVNLNSGSKIVNFPDDSPAGDVNLRGEATGSAVLSGCAPAQPGLQKIDIKLRNLSWADLRRDGGIVVGESSYRSVSTTCLNGRISYREEEVTGGKYSMTISTGGKGQVVVGPVAEFDVTLTPSGLEGDLSAAAKAQICSNAVSCSLHLVLNVVR